MATTLLAYFGVRAERQGRNGGVLERQGVPKKTSEPGMYMKTKEKLANCPGIIRTPVHNWSDFAKYGVHFSPIYPAFATRNRPECGIVHATLRTLWTSEKVIQ